MKRFFYTLVSVLGFLTAGLAQKGNHQVIIGLEAGFPTGNFNNYKTGLGFSGKGLFGVGDHSQLTFTTGYSSFKLKGSTDAYKVKTSVVPLLAGYRHNFSILYVEPQLGLGTYNTKTKSEIGNTETKSSHARSGFTLALGAGVQISSLDLGARYQVGYPDGDGIGFFAVHAGYSLFPKRK